MSERVCANPFLALFTLHPFTVHLKTSSPLPPFPPSPLPPKPPTAKPRWGCPEVSRCCCSRCCCRCCCRAASASRAPAVQAPDPADPAAPACDAAAAGRTSAPPLRPTWGCSAEALFSTTMLPSSNMWTVLLEFALGYSRMPRGISPDMPAPRARRARCCGGVRKVELNGPSNWVARARPWGGASENLRKCR